MITDASDGASPAKISVKRSESAVKAEAAIFTFSERIAEYAAGLGG